MYRILMDNIGYKNPVVFDIGQRSRDLSRDKTECHVNTKSQGSQLPLISYVGSRWTAWGTQTLLI